MLFGFTDKLDLLAERHLVCAVTQGCRWAGTLSCFLVTWKGWWWGSHDEMKPVCAMAFTADSKSYCINRFKWFMHCWITRYLTLYVTFFLKKLTGLCKAVTTFCYSLSCVWVLHIYFTILFLINVQMVLLHLSTVLHAVSIFVVQTYLLYMFIQILGALCWFTC